MEAVAGWRGCSEQVEVLARGLSPTSTEGHAHWRYNADGGVRWRRPGHPSVAVVVVEHWARWRGWVLEWGERHAGASPIGASRCRERGGVDVRLLAVEVPVAVAGGAAEGLDGALLACRHELAAAVEDAAADAGGVVAAALAVPDGGLRLGG